MATKSLINCFKFQNLFEFIIFVHFSIMWCKTIDKLQQLLDTHEQCMKKTPIYFALRVNLNDRVVPRQRLLYSCFCPWQSTYRLTLTECTWGRHWLATKCPYWKMWPSYAVLLLAKWTSDVNLSIMTSAADDVQSTVGQPKLIPHSWQRRQIVITTPSSFSILIIVQWHYS